jgi:hypothetical protein
MNEYKKIFDPFDLKKFARKKVVVEGTISEMPWQHLIGYIENYNKIYYFDINNDQIVIYSKDQISCTGKIKVYGTVVKIDGESKRPGSNEAYTEYHILVDKWGVS